MARHAPDRTARSSRRDRRALTVRAGGDRTVDGATVVKAVVHARLLGMRLLTLDARVVVAPADVEPSSLALMTLGNVDGVVRLPHPGPGALYPVGTAVSGPAGPSADGGVRRARELLAEGTRALARTARPA